MNIFFDEIDHLIGVIFQLEDKIYLIQSIHQVFTSCDLTVVCFIRIEEINKWMSEVDGRM
jgi:hypothetical protein